MAIKKIFVIITCDLWIENAQASFKGTCCLEINCPLGVLTIHFSGLIGTVFPHLNWTIGDPRKSLISIIY